MKNNFFYFLQNIFKNSNNNLYVPISDNGKDIKIDSHQTSKIVKLRSLYIGEFDYGHGLGVQGGWYLDEGKSELGLSVSLADAFHAHNNLDLIQLLGLHYRYYSKSN